MGCLDAVLEMGQTGFNGGEGALRDCMGLCYRELCLQCGPFIAVLSGQDGPPGKNRSEPRGVFFFNSPRGRSPNFVVSDGGV